MGFLSNKKILITGLASKLSISYGIAKSMFKQKAKLAFSYQNKKLKNRIKAIAQEFNSDIFLECDVSDDKSIKDLFFELKKTWSKFDGFVHSIAYAPKNQFNGSYIKTIDREGFKIAHDISSYSLVALVKYCEKMLNPNSSILTLTYLGSNRVIPNYNVMGLAKASLESNVRYMAYELGKKNIRVNAISSGPIKTLAASAIKNFKKMISYYKAATPIRRIITSEEIGNCAAFLCSDLSSGINGEILHVDGGFNIVSIKED